MIYWFYHMAKLVEHGSFEDLLSKKNYFYHLFMNAVMD